MHLHMLPIVILALDEGLFLGFQNDTKGYVVLDLDTKEIFISRHVIFHEMTLSFLKPSISYHATTFSLPPNPLHLPPFFPNYHPFPKSNHTTITPTTYVTLSFHSPT